MWRSRATRRLWRRFPPTRCRDASCTKYMKFVFVSPRSRSNRDMIPSSTSPGFTDRRTARTRHPDRRGPTDEKKEEQVARRVQPLSLASLSCWWWQTRPRGTLGHRSPFRSLGLVCRPTPNLNSCPGRPLERPIPLNKDRPHDGATTNHRRRCRQELDRRRSPRQRQSRAHRRVETRPSQNELLHGSCRAPGTRSSCSKLRAATSAR